MGNVLISINVIGMIFGIVIALMTSGLFSVFGWALFGITLIGTIAGVVFKNMD